MESSSSQSVNTSEMSRVKIHEAKTMLNSLSSTHHKNNTEIGLSKWLGKKDDMITDHMNYSGFP